MQRARATSPKLQLLGGLTPRQFLRRHWQKQPLLIRQAISGFKGVVSAKRLMRLAGHEDCHARLIWRRGRHWHLKHGPLGAADFAARGPRAWTVLVQDINHVEDAADKLLRKFRFIPHARLDDLMASYATAGGGVGPHVDSYDVFLLQGEGERRWQISRQRDLRLEPDAPIKLLSNFVPETEWVLQPGDMLYLPPGVAHCGTAVSDCVTYSIGFRAPSNASLQQGLLRFLEDRCDDLRLYADPALRPSAHPAAINLDFLAYCQRILEQVKWTHTDMVTFLGQYLSEPKATTFFSPPATLLPPSRFLQTAQGRGVALHAKTRMLYSGAHLFVNGERYPNAASSVPLRRLADERALSAAAVKSCASQASDLLYQWYAEGYLMPGAQ
jgi:50S ribosomal protein L16 3-hydroxylase